MTRAYDLEKWAPREFDYKEFSKGLASIQGIPVCPGCLKGGGREECEMRTCATNRGLQDCGECRDLAECKHAEILERMRSGAASAGLNVKVGQVDRQELLKEWTDQLRHKWPSCILFMD